MTPSDHRAHLLRTLAAHRPADAEEAADLVRMRAFVAANPDCFGRGNARGHITASAFVTDPAGRVLMTHHAKLDRWLQVGGHSEPDEHDPLLTALREAREESGLADLRAASPRPLDVDIHVIPGRGAVAAHDHLDVRYHLSTRDPGAIIVSAESHALRWCDAATLAALDLDPATRRAIGKLPCSI